MQYSKVMLKKGEMQYSKVMTEERGDAIQQGND